MLKANFTRASIAYLKDGTQVASGVPRFEWGRFGEPSVIKEGTTNLLYTQGGGASKDWSIWDHWNDSVYWHNTTQYDDALMGKVFKGVARSTVSLYHYDANYNQQLDKTYTFSVWLKASENINNVSINFYFNFMGSGATKIINIGTKWERFEWSITVSAIEQGAGVGLGPFLVPDGVTIFAAKPQLEENSHATDWVSYYRETTFSHHNKAIMVEEGTSNLLLPGQYNASDTALFAVDTSCVLSLETASPISGASSIKCVTPAVAVKGVYFSGAGRASVTAGAVYSAQAKLKGSGIVQVYLRIQDDAYVNKGDSELIDVTLTAEPQTVKIENFTIPTGGTKLQFIVRSKNAEACTIIADCYQLEAKPYATSFVDGTRVSEQPTVPAVNVLNVNEGTIEFWAYVNDTIKRYDGYNRTLFLAYLDETNFILLDHDSISANFRVYIRGNNISTVFNIPDSYVPNGWHRFGLSYNKAAGTVKLIIDDTLRVSGTGVTFPASYNTLYIGCNITDYRQSNTLIDDFCVSSVAKSDVDIIAGYQSSRAREL